MKPATKLSIIFLLIFSIVWASIGGYFFAKMGQNNTTIPEDPVDSTNTVFKEVYPEELIRNYRYDRIILFGQNENNEDFFVKYQLTRKQKNHELFDHSYSAYYIYKDKKDTVWDTFSSPKLEIQDSKILDDYYSESFEDKSTRENLNFNIIYNNFEANVNITGISGDFIVKNTSDYTRFISTGLAEIDTGEEKFTVNAMVDRILSSDYSQSIFFENRSELKHTTHSIALWDELNNFYLIDTTKVLNPEIGFNYSSHKWAVHKNTNLNSSTKAFDFDFDFNNLGSEDYSWVISIPEFNNAQFKLDNSAFQDSKNDKGIVKGSITDSFGTREIAGHFVYLNIE